MTRPAPRTLLCTTFYPSVERYWDAFVDSVDGQSTTTFALLVGLDGSPAPRRLPRYVECDVVDARAPSLSEVRSRLWSVAVERSDLVVMADADDVLAATRIEAAIEAYVRGADVSSCALSLIDEDGEPLDLVLGRGVDDAGALLPDANIIGGSNSAYASALLRRLLPIVSGLTVVDWFLAVRAWLLHATMHHAPVVGTLYRRHAGNLIGAGCALDLQMLQARARLAFEVFEALLPHAGAGERGARVRARAEALGQFAKWLKRSESAHAYVEAILERRQASDEIPPWWTEIAARDLEEMWRRT